jgi:23S rRNA (uracil1939-C5)-methyltransferase
MAALEVEDAEPPELEVDFPISVAVVLPDRRAATLVGDPFLHQQIKGRLFRVSPGSPCEVNPRATEFLIDVVLQLAALDGREHVLEANSGAGILTNFLAAAAREITAIEANEAALSDLAVNLEHTDNVTLYQGNLEEVLSLLHPPNEPRTSRPYDRAIIHAGGKGLGGPAIQQLGQLAPARLIVLSADAAVLARDGRTLSDAGFDLVEVQPIDLRPQTYHIDTVSLWALRPGFREEP